MATKGRRPGPPSEQTPHSKSSPQSPDPTSSWDKLTHEEKRAVVCRLFCAGDKPSVIAERIQKEYAPNKFSRQSVHRMLREAAEAGRFRFVPRASFVLSNKLRNRYGWLADVKVVHTNEFEDVAYQGAQTLIDLVQEVSRNSPQEVHIGFAGGHAMHRLAQIFAQLLDESDADLPEMLVLHALVAGFDVRNPTTDPNTFFTLFNNRTSVNTTYEYVGLHTPPVVRASEYDTLRNAEGIKESYDHAEDLDIIVTSAADWTDEHSTFRQYMEKSADCAEVLVKAGCIGDMLWRPVGSRGPLNVQTKIRSMTLIELGDLPSFTEKGKHVLLVLGPCAFCRKPKSRILSAILASEERLISHLVVDTRSAKETLRSPATAANSGLQ